jgi:Fic family protein
MVQAAMVHLNIAMLHPFSDGNGRTARCLQTAVLANEGINAPTFSSIEEYIGRNQQEYYDVLAEVGGGKWSPKNDSRPWIKFCLTAHYRQARTHLKRIEEVQKVYGIYADMVRDNGLNERCALGLLEASMGMRVRRASYTVSTDVSENTASRDLKAMSDAGLLISKGEKRGRYYEASLEVKKIRFENKLNKEDYDPFSFERPTGQIELSF